LGLSWGKRKESSETRNWRERRDNQKGQKSVDSFYYSCCLNYICCQVDIVRWSLCCRDRRREGARPRALQSRSRSQRCIFALDQEKALGSGNDPAAAGRGRDPSQRWSSGCLAPPFGTSPKRPLLEKPDAHGDFTKRTSFEDWFTAPRRTGEKARRLQSAGMTPLIIGLRLTDCVFCVLMLVRLTE
jgi:hypothetical protein